MAAWGQTVLFPATQPTGARFRACAGGVFSAPTDLMFATATAAAGAREHGRALLLDDEGGTAEVIFDGAALAVRPDGPAPTWLESAATVIDNMEARK